MAEPAQLIATMRVTLDEFERQMKKAGALADIAVNDIEKKFEKANPSFGSSFLKSFLTTLSGAVSVEALRQIVKTVGDIADEAERLQVSTDTLQALRFEMELAGGSAANLDSALAQFATRVGKAADGTSYLARVFRDNNIAMRDANGQFKSQQELLQSFALLVRNAGSEQDKMRLAVEAFGPSGRRMVEVLNQIATKGLAGVVAEAQNAGLIVDKELVKRADEFDKVWSTVLARQSANVKSFALSIIDAVATWTKELEKLPLRGRTFEEFQRGLAPSGLSIEQRRELQEAARFAAGGPGTESLEEFRARTQGAPRTTIIPPRREPRERLDELDREERRMRRNIEVMDAETRTIGQSAEVRARARAEAQLMDAAQRAGIPTTEALRERVAALADAYAAAAQRAELARKVMEAVEQFGSAISDAFKAAVIQGQKLDDVLKNLLQRLASMAADEVFRNLFRIGGSALAGGLPGPGFAAFGTGGSLGIFQHGGRIKANSPGIVGEAGPELFVPRTAGTIIPNNAMGGTAVTYAPTIDARGADMAAVARLEAVIAEDRRALPGRVIAAVSEAKRRSAIR